MLSDEQSAKLEKTFTMLDVTGDGHIDKSDFEAKAQAALQVFGEPSTSLKGKRVIEAYLWEWDKGLAQAAGVGTDGSLTLDAFKQVGEQHIATSGEYQPGAERRSIVEALVDLADKDGDGVLDREEYAIMSKAIGLGKGDAESAFLALDTNGDGRLSAEEIATAWHNYYSEEDESATQPAVLGDV